MLPNFQGLLQAFADKAHGRHFDALGVEDDFDHGHVLLADGAPVAILYHTQELSKTPGERNWVQRLSDGSIVNARRLERAVPPASLPVDLEALRARKTILPEMLDPAAFGAGALSSRQVVFTRSACPGAVKVRLRGRLVCLSLSEY